jgi:hypothetical protein
MPTVEIWSDRGRDHIVTLDAASYTIGSDIDSADIVLSDATVSRVHAMLERVGSAWLVRDVGSRNGTRLGGERLIGQSRLRHGDELILGRTRLVFLDSTEAKRPMTDALAPPPDNLTRMERRVLIELCRPLVSYNAFQPPASVREMASRLFIGRNAVQAHLSNLYDKFAIEPGGDRRVILANEAMQRGAVTIADLDDRRDGHG